MRKQFATVLVALVLAVSAAGCSTASTPDPTPSAKPTSMAKPTEKPTPTPTVTPTPAPTPTPDPWQRFTDARMPYSFETPPGWAVVEQPSPYGNQGVLQFLVNDAAGKQQLVFSSQASGLGGRCGDATPVVIQELDAESLEIPGYSPQASAAGQLVAPRFVYRAMQTSKGIVSSLALTDQVAPESCYFYNLLHPAAGTIVFADAAQVSVEYPPHLFASLDEAKTYIQSDEYKTLKRILLSLQIAG